MERYGFVRHHKRCQQCSKMLYMGDMVFICYRYGIRFMCQECSERENMSNIKITAEVDGKQVPLENISTETFEAIKALEKPKEIPIARVGNWKSEPNRRRLFLKITKSIKNSASCLNVGDVAVIDLKDGLIKNAWSKNSTRIEDFSGLYENIKTL